MCGCTCLILNILEITTDGGLYQCHNAEQPCCTIYTLFLPLQPCDLVGLNFWQFGSSNVVLWVMYWTVWNWIWVGSAFRLTHWFHLVWSFGFKPHLGVVQIRFAKIRFSVYFSDYMKTNRLQTETKLIPIWIYQNCDFGLAVCFRFGNFNEFLTPCTLI